MSLVQAGAPPSAPVSSMPDFREALGSRLRRWFFGALYAVMPKRAKLLPRLTILTLAHLVAPEGVRDQLPTMPTYYGERGLVGLSDDLSVNAILANYRRGLFPVCHIGPMKWWSPAERAICAPEDTHVSKNLVRLMRQDKFRVTFDRDFAGVMRACSEPRDGRAPLTWITPRIMRAYWALHEAGYAHSVEVWDPDGKLVGGLYGVAIGDVFFGESQFSHVEHTSKIAVAVLHRHLAHWGYAVRDGKWMTPHLTSLGFTTVDRATFHDLLKRHTAVDRPPSRWQVDPTLEVAGWYAQKRASARKASEPSDPSRSPQAA